MKEKTALITGASSGIGKATAEALATLGIHLVLCGRRKEKLEALKEKLSSRVEVETLAFDVRFREQIREQLATLPAKFQQIDILVNNAGNAHGLDFIDEGNHEDWDRMIDANVKGLLYVSEFVIPQMIKAGKGHIINLSSIAGKEVYPKGNVYCASKFAVEAISQGMRLDLNPHGIKVTNIAPGAVNTEFSMVRFKDDQERAENVYKGFDPLVAEDVAETIAFVVSRPAHVVISDLTILPLAQASAKVFNKN